MGLLLVLIPLVYLTFAPVYFDGQMDRYDKAKALHYAFLDRVQVEGYLTTQDENRLYAEFDKIGCTITNLDCPRESQGSARVLRSDSISDSLITMEITFEPDLQGLKIGGLVGAKSSDSVFHLEGSVISERVTP